MCEVGACGGLSGVGVGLPKLEVIWDVGGCAGGSRELLCPWTVRVYVGHWTFFVSAPLRLFFSPSSSSILFEICGQGFRSL